MGRVLNIWKRLFEKKIYLNVKVWCILNLLGNITAIVRLYKTPKRPC